MKSFDAIVIGLGGMGSATACELARRGQKIVGLEQFSFGHTLGSSHGQSRIIRQAYFEHPDYVPLLQAAYAGWNTLAATTEDALINLCGLVMAGPAEGEVIAGTREAARMHGLPLDTVPPEEAPLRYPGLAFLDGDTVLHDPLGGYLRVETCVAAHLAEAQKHGAELHEKEAVVDWQAAGDGVIVRTATEQYHANRLVICAGSWSSRMMASLGLPLDVRRVVTAWFPTTNPAHLSAQSPPIFAFQTPEGFFYGFPQLDPRGVKLACHHPGAPVADPATVDRVVTPADLQPLQRFAARYVPGLANEASDATVCLYTMTPDGHFILDRHPEHDQVAFAAGFSGHGFKFCPAIGTILADLAVDGHTKLPCEFLSLQRLRSVSDT